MKNWTKNFRCQDCYDTGFIPDSYSLETGKEQKCTNKIHNMKTTNSTLPAKILTTEEIAKKFVDYSDTAARYDKYVLALIIEDTDKLAVASNNVAQISNAINNIENIRKSTGEPHFNTVKEINGYAKVLSDPLERIKKIINGKITDFKVMQEAQAKIKRDQEAAALALIVEEKKKELLRLTTIQSMVKGMLYGGDYTNMKGEARSSEGCKTATDCTVLRTLVTDKFPSPSSLKYCNKDAETIYATIIGWIDAHISSLELLSKVPTESNTLLNSVMSAGKTAADNDVAEIHAEATKTIDKETAKEEKKLDKTVTDAKKGVRRTLKFEVLDPNIVPVEYKTVSDALVNEYLAANKEKIMFTLKNGSSWLGIPGIKFFVHDQNIG